MVDGEAEVRAAAQLDDLVRRYDGAERIPLLSYAQLVVISPTDRAEDPVSVLVRWTPDSFERPVPGSSLWRAILQRRLAQPIGSDPADQVLRDQIASSLGRWPNLETWWHWLRTGWTAPPRVPASSEKARRGRRLWWF